MPLEEWTIQPLPTRSGGQGSVAFVVHNETGTLGALKRMHPELAKEKERRFRFYSEVGALKAMAGQSVPRVIESNEELFLDGNSDLYLIMERISGSSLSDYVSRCGNVGVSEALNAINKILEIVDIGHRLEIFHRDLKPDNIMVRDNDISDPVIVDYGMSWSQPAHEKQSYNTPRGKELGNRFLRLPEYAPNGSHRDSRSDLTMVVGLLFYLLVGVAPRQLVFESGYAPHDHLDAEIPEELKLAECWPRLRSVFNIGFQHRIEMRFQTAKELSSKLKQVCTSSPNPREDGFLKELATFREKNETIEAQRRQAHLESIISTSRTLENEMKSAFADKGFSVKGFGTNSRSGGTQVEFTLLVIDEASGRTSELFKHSIDTDFLDVQSSYQLNYGTKHDVLTGKAADFESFERDLMSTKITLMTEILRSIAV